MRRFDGTDECWRETKSLGWHCLQTANIHTRHGLSHSSRRRIACHGTVLSLIDPVGPSVTYALYGDTCLRWPTSMIGREAMRLKAGFERCPSSAVQHATYRRRCYRNEGTSALSAGRKPMSFMRCSKDENTAPVSLAISTKSGLCWLTVLATIRQ